MEKLARGLVPASMAGLQLLSVDQALALLGVGRTSFYEMVSQGRIAPVKLGRRTLVKTADLQAFIASLPTVGGAP